MRAHMLVDNIVVNTIEVESLDVFPNLIDGEVGMIGWRWDGETLTGPESEIIPSEVVIADKIEQLWKAADSYVTSYISGVAIGILTIGVLQGKPKAQAISAWSNQVWTEYYTRKSAITTDSVLDLDFSGFGAIPYSIPELQAEVFA